MEKLTLKDFSELSFGDRMRYAEQYPDHALDLQRTHNRERIAAALRDETLTADDVTGRMWSELTADEKRKLRNSDQDGAARLIREQREHDEHERASLNIASIFSR